MKKKAQGNPDTEIEIHGKMIRVNRPAPIISGMDVFPYRRRMDPQLAVDTLLEGQHVLVIDFYSGGLSILNLLKKQLLKKKYPGSAFQKQRAFRNAYRKASHRLLLEISDNKLQVRKAPEISWLNILYPDHSDFLLPFPVVQGLNSAWQWYKNGIVIPQLENRLHPYYGSYFPTRFEHLELFDKWLSGYQGVKKSAFDIGTGSGILSFQMLQHGFEMVCGTDSNPNAIASVSEHLVRNRLQDKMELKHGDLFAGCEDLAELIVFNPPWLPGSYEAEGIDKAIYYDETLFPRFFEESIRHLIPGGRLLLLFSNLGLVTETSNVHPIEMELLEGGRFKKEQLIRKSVTKASDKTKRDQNWRETEHVELWELSLK